jgi:hypothetical protein
MSVYVSLVWVISKADNLTLDARQTLIQPVVEKIEEAVGELQFPPGTRGQQLVRRSSGVNDVRFVDRDVWTFIQADQPSDYDSLDGDFWVVVTPGFDCAGLQTAFDSLNGLYFVSRNYIDDFSGSGDPRTATIVNTAIGSPTSFNPVGSTINLNPIGGNPALSQCDPQDVADLNSANNANIRHGFSSGSVNEYTGKSDHCIAGGVFLCEQNKTSRMPLGTVMSYADISANWNYNIWGVYWNPSNGNFTFENGQTDIIERDRVSMSITGTADSIGFADTPGTTQPRWMNISWEVRRAGGGSTGELFEFEVWCNGKQIGVTGTSVTNDTGDSIAGEPWYRTDSPAYDDARYIYHGFGYGNSSGSGARYYDGQILYTWHAPNTMNLSTLHGVIQNGFESQFSETAPPGDEVIAFYVRLSKGVWFELLGSVFPDNPDPGDIIIYDPDTGEWVGSPRNSQTFVQALTPVDADIIGGIKEGDAWVEESS